MTKLRVLIVDDERLARTGIRRQLERYPDLEIVGEASSGAQAIAGIRDLSPDLVFLDVQMPAGDAFHVIEEIGPARMPAVVFVTAYNEHAIRAFEADAVDYLLKPVDPDRLDAAVGRVLRRIGSGPSRDVARTLEALLGRFPSKAERIAVEEQGRYQFVAPEAVLWVEAADNYVRLHTSSGIKRLRSTLETIHQRLGPRFIRVGRSILVNRDAVESAEHFAKGSYVLFLRGGQKIRTSRHFREQVVVLLRPPS